MTVKAALAGMFAAGMLFGVGAANAADMGRPVYKAPMEAAPAFSWTGFYIGAVTGYAWGDADIGGGVLGLLGSTQQTKPDGWIAGGTVGYNYQQGNLVLGTEGEFFWSNVDGTASNGILGINGTYSNDWTGAVSTRLGVAFGTFLVYSKAGIAWAKNEYTLNVLAAAAHFRPPKRKPVGSSAAVSNGLSHRIGRQRSKAPIWTSVREPGTSPTASVCRSRPMSTLTFRT